MTVLGQVRVPRGGFAVVEGRKRGHLVGAKAEVEDREVLDQAFGV